MKSKALDLTALQATPAGGRFTYEQRYYVCDEFWRHSLDMSTSKRPIFFYVGNEADVTLYVLCSATLC